MLSKLTLTTILRRTMKVKCQVMQLRKSYYQSFNFAPLHDSEIKSLLHAKSSVLICSKFIISTTFALQTIREAEVNLCILENRQGINRPKDSGVNHVGNSDKKRPEVTSTNSLQMLSLSNKQVENQAATSTSTIDAHYEANYKEKTLIEINRNRLNRKIQNLEN